MTRTRLYSAKQTRDLDRIAIDEHGIPGYELMKKAGFAVYSQLRKHWPEHRSLLIFCGPGNNGGDGYVIARLALQEGLQPQVISLVGEPKAGSDAATAMDDFLAAGGKVENQLPTETPAERPGSDPLTEKVLVVDALLGTGLDRTVQGTVAQAIHWINRQGWPCIAVDIASGINADTGMAMGCAVEADISISFIGRKKGIYTGEAANYSGRLLFDNLDVPESVYEKVPHAAELLDLTGLIRLLPPRYPADHKGAAGHVLLIGGNRGMAGAIRLAGEATARTGAGLTSIATLPEHVAAVVSGRPELMVHGCVRAGELDALLDRADIVALGPGLGRSSWSQDVMAKVLDCSLPLVLDADALNLLAEDPQHRDQWILTPHPGEAARLLNKPIAEINQDRFAAVQTMQHKYGGVCLLKGAGTLIAHSNGISVCPYGNAGMASGGMGDVLTGIIAGLLAQGAGLQLAAELGACLHGRAADLVAGEQGERGMLAGDLANKLPRLLNQISR